MVELNLFLFCEIYLLKCLAPTMASDELTTAHIAR